MAAALIDRYIALERMMMDADERGDETFAEAIRELMDSLWYRLDDQEHDMLNTRGFVSISSLYPLTLPATNLVIERRRIPAQRSRNKPLQVGNWRLDVA